jgi:hypothetical protein
MSDSLIEISKHVDSLFEQAEEWEANGHEVPEDLQDSINSLVTHEAEKVDRCCAYIKKTEANIAWLKAEKDAIDALIKRQQSRIDHLKFRAKQVLEGRGEQNLEGLKGHKFYLRSSTSVAISDENQIPGDYLVTTTRPDKAKIKKAINEGTVVMGASLKFSKSVVVK